MSCLIYCFGLQSAHFYKKIKSCNLFDKTRSIFTDHFILSTQDYPKTYAHLLCGSISRLGLLIPWSKDRKLLYWFEFIDSNENCRDEEDDNNTFGSVYKSKT